MSRIPRKQTFHNKIERLTVFQMLYLAIESLAKTLNTSVAKYTNKKISILE